MDWDDEKYFPHETEDEDYEEDGDDDDYEDDVEDEEDEEDESNPLTNPLKESLDTFIRFRKVFRRFRHRRRPVVEAFGFEDSLDAVEVDADKTTATLS